MYDHIYKIRESLTVPKQELGYKLKSLTKAKKSPTYSDYSADWSEKQRCYKILLCAEYIGNNATWVQFHAALQFLTLFVQPVNLSNQMTMMILW